MSRFTTVSDRIRAQSAAPEFRGFLTRFLLDLCRVDTTPKHDLRTQRVAESATFAIIEQELRFLGLPGLRLEYKPIGPAIARHPAFTPPYFASAPGAPAAASPAVIYCGRTNLVAVVPGTDTRTGGPALNTHIDVVEPYFPPHSDRGVIHGRGACDAKGQAVSAVGGLRLLATFLGAGRQALPRNVVAMFAVEEETGGNGSLALALDTSLRRFYDSVLVLEPTGFLVHPANRGAVWYRLDLDGARVPLLEPAAFAVLALEREGAAIRAESAHPLFPDRPVQTCHGVLGPFGQHPSRICAEVGFRVVFDRTPTAAAFRQVRARLDAGLAEYVAAYGDKTAVSDPLTGRPKVDHHLDAEPEGRALKVAVHGASGHMGSVRENDGAIAKAAYLVRALVQSRDSIAARTRCRFVCELAAAAAGPGLVLEGGQGFLPTHGIGDIQARVAAAAERGVQAWRAAAGGRGGTRVAVRASFDKLHTAAFACDPKSRPGRNATAALGACGVRHAGPVTGWAASCDARLFATQYPGLPVLTCGPGQLSVAHSERECLSVDDLATGAAFVALYLLREAQAVARPD